MPVYLVADIDVHDPETYDRYSAAAQTTFAGYGEVKYLVRGGEATVLEGDWTPKRFTESGIADERIAKDGSHDLHVLLRHRLLRKPGGFEAIGAARVLLDAADLAALDGDDLSDLHLHRDPTACTVAREADPHERPIAAGLDLKRVHLQVGIGLDPGASCYARSPAASRASFVGWVG